MTTVNSMIWSMNIKYFQFLHILMIAGMIELSSSNAVLSITDDKWQINCGSSVVLNCTLQNVPSIVMSWQLNGILAADCDSSICYPPSGMPSHYVTTVGNGTLYHLTINPVKLTDNYTISCTDGTGSSPINTTVRVPVKPSEFTVSKDVQSNKTVITVLTNCIFAPMESLRFKLQYQKGSNENVSYINDFHPNEVIDCSYVDNPDCGGNSTGRAKANMTIDTAQTGTTYFFKLVVFQSNTQFPAIDIGNYILPDTNNIESTDGTQISENTRSTTAPSTTSSTATSTTHSDTSRAITYTDTDTSTDSPTCVLPVSYVHLFVGTGLLFVLIISCVIHVLYISIKGKKRSDKQIENGQSVMRTDRHVDY